MAKDSKLWQLAHDSYKEMFPTSKYNHEKVQVRQPLDKEPMVLLEEYRNLTEQIKPLLKRKKAIYNQLRKQGKDVSRYARSDYFERPILLYSLKLQGGCWYVGMSRNVDKRFLAHKKGETLWTKSHKPIQIHEVRETGITSDSDASILEDEMTLEYAREYGVDYVRGGGFCQRKPRWPREAFMS